MSRVFSRRSGLALASLLLGCRPESAFGVLGTRLAGPQETVDGITYAWDRRAIEIDAGDRSLDLYPSGCSTSPQECLRGRMGLCTLRVERRFFFDPDCTGVAQTVSDVEARLNNDRTPTAAEQREYRRHRRELRVESAYWTWLLYFAPRRLRPDGMPRLEHDRGLSGLLFVDIDGAGLPSRYQERFADNRITYEPERLVVESIAAGSAAIPSGFEVKVTRGGTCYTRIVDAETTACDPKDVHGVSPEDFKAVWHGLTMADAFATWQRLFDMKAVRPGVLGGHD